MPSKTMLYTVPSAQWLSIVGRLGGSRITRKDSCVAVFLDHTDYKSNDITGGLRDGAVASPGGRPPVEVGLLASILLHLLY